MKQFLQVCLSYLKPLAQRFRGVTLAARNGKVESQEFSGELAFTRPYDDTLLDRVTLRWQFGDWDSLVQVRDEDFAGHPNKERIALYIGSGHLQLGNQDLGRRYVAMAVDWGCNRELVNRVLISGVYSAFGSAAFIAGDQSSDQILEYFEQSIRVGAPQCDPELLSQARLGVQRKRLESSYVNDQS